ncbi:MAG: hypothetical protein ACRC1M_00380, partial [Methanobacteriaceae archaeon]
MEFRLRNLSINDSNSIAKYANNINIANKLRNAFPYPYTIDDAREFINSSINNINDNNTSNNANNSDNLDNTNTDKLDKS